MKASNHEYFTIVPGPKLVQVTFVPRIELMYINLARYYKAEGWDIPLNLVERIELAINRLLKHEASNVKR